MTNKEQYILTRQSYGVRLQNTEHQREFEKPLFSKILVLDGIRVDLFNNKKKFIKKANDVKIVFKILSLLRIF